MWDDGCAPRGGDLPLTSYRGPGCHPWKIFENTGANLCNLVHFWRPVQQKVYNSVFNLGFAFGRSIWWRQVIKCGTENWRFSMPIFKVVWYLLPLPYRFRSLYRSCCPRRKSSSSRILEDQFTSPCPRPRTRTLASTPNSSALHHTGCVQNSESGFTGLSRTIYVHCPCLSRTV